MGEQIFREAGQKTSTEQALSSTSSTGSPLDGHDNDQTNHDIDGVWDPSGALLGTVEKRWGGGSYGIGGSGGEGAAAKEEEGRRRHDLSLVREISCWLLGV